MGGEGGSARSFATEPEFRWSVLCGRRPRPVSAGAGAVCQPICARVAPRRQPQPRKSADKRRCTPKLGGGEARGGPPARAASHWFLDVFRTPILRRAMRGAIGLHVPRRQRVKGLVCERAKAQRSVLPATWHLSDFYHNRYILNLGFLLSCLRAPILSWIAWRPEGTGIVHLANAESRRGWGLPHCGIMRGHRWRPCRPATKGLRARG